MERAATRPGFGDVAKADIVKAITENPFAWVSSAGPDGPVASAIPIRPIFDTSGEMTGLQGHFARSNPQVKALEADHRALFLFTGPHGYISPSWYHDRTQAPTWNFVSIQVSARIRFVSSDEALRAIIDDLASHLEAGRKNAWSVEDMGARYQRLSRGIVGFHATDLDLRPKFKLGQDEPDHVYGDILSGLRAEEREDLVEWIIRYNTRERTRE